MAAAFAILDNTTGPQVVKATTRLRVATGKNTAPAEGEVEVLDRAVATGDWSEFERIVVAFSGGKDSMACLLRLIDAGAPTEKIELWHHDVDGQEGSDLMDWPVTRHYCRKVATHFGIPLLFSWKVGGFEGEMLRKDVPTNPTKFELLDGTVKSAGGKGPNGTRGLYPQVSADLKVRWCSAYLKIDVASKVFANDPRFKSGGRFLMVTGERREESAARSKYAEIEKDRACTKSRNVLRWRAVLDFTEAEVYDLMEKHNIEPHPAYVLGFGRVSCAFCIFGNDDQWATLQDLFPTRFEYVAKLERESGKTIHRTMDIHERAARGTSFVANQSEEDKAAGRSKTFDKPIVATNWTLPAGAFTESGGPS